ncbi:S-layer protein [Solibacillus cecembensis]|uniref:S-layer protein n=1 Tax=Solibacillus cecembensis TaxID=459347 RepID=UPI003D078186
MKKKALNTFMATALTATLILPVSTATASINPESIVVADQGSKIPSGTVSLTITSFSNDTIYTSSGQMTVNNALKPIFKSENRTALANAQATVTIENGKITNITSLILSKKGTAKKPIVFDGGEATISGSLTVAADYTKIQNVVIKKELIVSSRVKKGLTLNNVSVGDKIKFQPLRMNKINWFNVSLTNMPKTEINVQRNKVGLISDKSLTQINVTDDVPQLKVESDVEKLLIDVKKDFSLSGEGQIKHVTVKKGKKVDLDSSHQFKDVKIDDKNANVTVTIVDKTALNALIAVSGYVAVSVTGHDVASTDKWTTQAEKSTFEAIFNSAQAVANDKKSSQDQINVAHTQLNSALATYKAAQKNGKKHVTGDKSAITVLINSVQYVTVSWRNGSELSSNSAWTTQAEKDALVSAVTSAQSVVNSYNPSLEQIVNALNYLESAITTYKSAQKYGMSGYAGDRSTLQSLINSVQYVEVSWNEGIYLPTNIPWTTQGEKDALISVVESAQSVSNNYNTTQNIITNAINNLNNALAIYKSAQKYGPYGNNNGGYYGDRSKLTGLIDSTYKYYVTSYNYWDNIPYNATIWTTQEAKDAFDTAITNARYVAENYNYSQYDIATAIDSLNAAIKNYENSYKYGPDGDPYWWNR